MSADRAHRVAESIRSLLAEAIRAETGDPRLAMLSITDAKVSRDLSVADVYVSSFTATDAPAQTELVAVLNRAAGFLRRALARRLHLGHTPRLRFHYDELPAEGPRLDAIISQAVCSDRHRGRQREG